MTAIENKGVNKRIESVVLVTLHGDIRTVLSLVQREGTDYVTVV